VESNEEDGQGEIEKYEEGTLKVSDGETVAVFLCLHHVTSFHNVVIPSTETDLFLVTEL
jgi:hypothetical protein